MLSRSWKVAGIAGSLSTAALVAGWLAGGRPAQQASAGPTDPPVVAAAQPDRQPVIRLVASVEEEPGTTGSAAPSAAEPVSQAPASLLPQSEAAAPDPLKQSAVESVGTECTEAAAEHRPHRIEASPNILKIRYSEASPANDTSDSGDSTGEPAAAEHVPAPPAQSAGCQNCKSGSPECQTCPVTGEVGFGRIEKSCSDCNDMSLRDRACAMHDSHHPRFYQERPFGTYVRSAAIDQIRNGLADQMVLYQYDFRQGDRAAELSLRGKYQLTKFAVRLFECGMPVVIESTPATPELAQSRREYVIGVLKELDSSFTQADDLVVVGRPRVPGLRGEEAQIIDGTLLMETQSRGTIGPGAQAEDNSDSQSNINQ